MIEISIPGYAKLAFQHLVLDYNGTLACDGALRTGVADALRVLVGSLRLHIVTGDTFGKACSALAGLACMASTFPVENQSRRKQDYVEKLGAARTACIGNGRSDRLMFEAAALAVAVVHE